MEKHKEPFSYARVQFFFLACILFLTGCAPAIKQSCLEQRTAFDIGSATLKMKIARVDTCRNVTLEILHQKDIKVPFAENIREQRLTPEIQNRGIRQLQALKAEAQNLGSRHFAGVATAVFRRAANTQPFLAEIKDKTGIHVKLISQDEEAILGYQAAMAHDRFSESDIVVWDIGGNSMQLIMKEKDRTYRIYRGRTASVSFKQQLIEKFYPRTAGNLASPNPIGRQNLNAALEMAMQAAADVPEVIQYHLRRPQTVLIGIGGVHNSSIRNQTGKNVAYSQQDLRDALKRRVDLTDGQIDSRYPETEVSNLILVLGFMKKLDITEVRLINVNLTDGVLIDPAFW